MTQHKKARKHKIDSTFFPPVPDSLLSGWEEANGLSLPPEWREYYRQSDGLEAQRGELWPLLPIEEIQALPRSSRLANQWLVIGHSSSHQYLLCLGIESSVWRTRHLGSKSEFFATSLSSYLKLVFKGNS